MAATTDIREIVDRLMLADKVPSGQARWAAEHRQGVQRLSYPLLINGEVSDATLQIKAFPRDRSLRFTLLLLYGRAVSRLDFGDDEEHVNSFNRPTGLPLGPILAPHYHAWEDNRRFATRNSLPEKLENARVLDANLRTFPNVFRWFCGQTNINISDWNLPELPTSDIML